MRGLFGALRWAFRTTWFLVFVAMLALNVATLTVSGVAALANGALATVGVTTVAARTAAAAAPTRATMKRVTGRVARRVSRGAARSVTAVAGESLPYIGAAVVIGVTAAELKDACDTMQDLHELEAALGHDGETDMEAEKRRVCGYEVPTLEDVKAGIADAPGKAWESAKSLPDVSLPDISPDWAGYDAAIRGWFVTVRTWFGGLFAD